MRLVAGSDHAGLELKNALVAHLIAAGHEVTDLGTYTRDSCDYPDVAHVVTAAVLAGNAERGLLVCGTGQGMAIAANKAKGIRAACVSDTFSARMVAMHNDANVLCVGARVVGGGLAADIVDAWVGAAFEGGRHAARVAKIEGGD